MACPCPSFSLSLSSQPSEWAPSQLLLASPSFPCPGPSALPPYWHTSTPSLCPALCTTTSLILTWARRTRAPAAPREQGPQAATAVLNCHKATKAETQFFSTSKGPHNPVEATASIMAQPSHLLEMLKLWGNRGGKCYQAVCGLPEMGSLGWLASKDDQGG